MMRRAWRAVVAFLAGPCGWADFGTEVRDGWAEMREEWRETIAVIRQQRQLEHRLGQRITGKDNPTRREVRHTGQAILAELDELEAIECRVVAEHERESGQ